MPFYKGPDGQALRLFRGECTHPAYDTPKSNLRALYFGDIDTANIYSEVDSTTGNYYTSRVYPVHLVLDRPFIDQPDDPFLELSDVAERLGKGEAKRIALRFAKYIEETDNWRKLSMYFRSVPEYLSERDDLSKLYFQAHRFFESLMEVNRLRKLGYDGAIHGGSGHGSAGKAEFCVFDRKQVYFTASKTFLGKE
jgi:hypothetical protein